jgi:hypothetical protein
VIVRVLRGHVEPNHATMLWGQLSERLAHAEVPEGQLSATFGRQVHGDGTESFVYVTTWRDVESIYAWVGGVDLVSTPRFLRGLEELVDTLEVQHYLGFESDAEQADVQVIERGEPERVNVDACPHRAYAGGADRRSAVAQRLLFLGRGRHRVLTARWSPPLPRGTLFRLLTNPRGLASLPLCQLSSQRLASPCPPSKRQHTARRGRITASSYYARSTTAT